MRNLRWSSGEKKAARRLLDRAREREYRELMDEINALRVESPEDIWELRERLNEKAREMNERYNYHYSRLIYVFAQLVHLGYLRPEEIEELGEAKAKKIKVLLDWE